MKYTVKFREARSMQLVTYFSPKGGAGRTTSLMATASGFLSAGHSVAVLDLTEQVRPEWIFGPSFISRWQERMLETGAKPNRFVAAPAPDYETAAKALDQFFREGFDYVLVDTAALPDIATTQIMNQSDLVIVPMRGPIEAAWASAWLAANRYPEKRTYGLVTGPREYGDERFARAAFTGTPMLQSHLPELATFDRQFETGLLRAQQLWKTPIEEDEQEEFVRLSYDWTTAFTSADRMCDEIKQLLHGQIYPVYPINTPLATGGTFAHMHPVMQQAGYSAPTS